MLYIKKGNILTRNKVLIKDHEYKDKLGYFSSSDSCIKIAREIFLNKYGILDNVPVSPALELIALALDSKALSIVNLNVDLRLKEIDYRLIKEYILKLSDDLFEYNLMQSYNDLYNLVLASKLVEFQELNDSLEPSNLKDSKIVEIVGEDNAKVLSLVNKLDARLKGKNMKLP